MRLKFVCDISGYMNMIVAVNNDAGFEMSATIEAKTKGIWIWCVPHPKMKDRCLALMDTEGLGDPMKVHASPIECCYKHVGMQFAEFSRAVAAGRGAKGTCVPGHSRSAGGGIWRSENMEF